MYVCEYVCAVSAQKRKIMIKNFQKYFDNIQDRKGKYSLKTLCLKENGLSYFSGANNAHRSMSHRKI